MDKLSELREKSIKLREHIQSSNYIEAQLQIEVMNENISQMLTLQNDIFLKMKLIGIIKTLEDIKNAIEQKQFDNAELYTVIHLSVLLENDESTKKELAMCKKTLKVLKDRVSMLDMLEGLIRQEVVTPNNFIAKYANIQDDEIKEIVDYIRKYQIVKIYNYDHFDYYFDKKVDVFLDEEVGMNYTMYMDKRMYFPPQSSEDKIIEYMKGNLAEQDRKSPHCYEKENFLVQDGDVVIDAGVAEGNFALSIIDKVKKIYLVECEENWIKALKKTFEPYSEKVVFVKKYLSNIVDDNNITIDALVKDEEINYIKMDIEGAERLALQGASNTMKKNKRLTIVACSYHKRGDEEWIKNYLNQYGFQTETSKGYMFFYRDMQARLSLELRRGLVFGKKWKM